MNAEIANLHVGIENLNHELVNVIKTQMGEQTVSRNRISAFSMPFKHYEFNDFMYFYYKLERMMLQHREQVHKIREQITSKQQRLEFLLGQI